MRVALLALVASLAAAAAFAPAGGASGECRGIQQCIRVPGPWVEVPAHGRAQFLLSCPGGRSIVGGLDAQVTSRDVRVTFEGRLGAPVQPGVTTTRYALFVARSFSGRQELFQPLLGCIPTQGGGGRSTVSARVSPPGPAPELRSRVVRVLPGTIKFGSVSCRGSERLLDSWYAVAYRTKRPPARQNTGQVSVTEAVVQKKVAVTVSATDALSIDVNPVVQVGAVCAP